MAQILFFGALLSAIKSCASATLLAPSVTFTENILRPATAPSHRPPAAVLDAGGDADLHAAGHLLRHVFHGQHLQDGRERLPDHLVSAFVPLVCGLYWRRATNQGALLSIFWASPCGWRCIWPGATPLCAGPLAGLIASAVGMVVGSLIETVRPHDIHSA